MIMRREGVAGNDLYSLNRLSIAKFCDGIII